MRNSRNMWTFFNHPTKTSISAKDVIYWKKALAKILKCGMEFEYNLPEKNGNCKGNSSSCPCVKMETECWKKCGALEKCEIEPAITRCKNVNKVCKEENCAACTNYALVCHGLFCADFVSACMDCEEFEISCTDCPNKFDPEKNPENIRSRITENLQPNQTYGQINKSGVHSVVTDGSLLGGKGAEIVTIGRRVDYWEFFNMAKNIIDTSVSKGAWINERCSIHMHLLASYYSKLVPDGHGKANGMPNQISELERPMPEIILANFHQLVRRYQNAMTWMMTALDDPKKITRWEKFRVSVIPISAILNSMANVKSQVADSSGGNKYGWVNYKYTDFKANGDVSRFHVEFRALDGVLSPSVVAAIACLYYALMIKAVEISKYGVVEVGDKDWMKQTNKVKKALLNNMKGYGDGDRFGHTEDLHNYYEILTAESLDLVRQLKHILISIGPAYDILESLAQKPVSLRRIDGEDWEKIESDLAIPMTEENKFETILSEWIDLRMITECANVDEWAYAVGQAFKNNEDIMKELDLGQDVEQRIEEFVETRKNDGDLIWSNTLGAVVLL